MVDRGDGARFTLKPAHTVGDQPLDGDGAFQASIVRLVDPAHASRADQRLDRVRAESGPWGQVLENLVVGCRRCEDLLYCVVAKRQRRTAPDDGGEQDVV